MRSLASRILTSLQAERGMHRRTLAKWKFARRAFLAMIVGASPALMGVQEASAQVKPWPTRTVRLILPLGPGSGSDISARLLADKLQRKWGQSVVVENRPGGDSLIALGAFAQANDDHVFFYGPAGTITPHVWQHEKLPYDPVKDVRPVASISSTTLAAAVPTELGVNTLGELVALARKNPGSLNAAAAAGLSELFWDGFVARHKLDIAKVPYKNIVEATTDVGAARLQIVYTALPMIQPGVQTGKVKIIAITSDKRIASEPDVPTATEAGFPDFRIAGLVGMVGSRAVSDELRRRIGADMLEVMQEPDFAKRLLATGQEPQFGGADQFSADIERQTAQIAEIANLLGMKRLHKVE